VCWLRSRETVAQITSVHNIAAKAHDETIRAATVSQQSSVAHSEALQRMNAEWSSSRTATETHLASHQRWLAKLESKLMQVHALVHVVRLPSVAPHFLVLTPTPGGIRRSTRCITPLISRTQHRLCGKTTLVPASKAPAGRNYCFLRQHPYLRKLICPTTSCR
jgi:hypothetical protein